MLEKIYVEKTNMQDELEKGRHLLIWRFKQKYV